MWKKMLASRMGGKLVLVAGLAFMVLILAAPKAHALIDLLWWLRK